MGIEGKERCNDGVGVGVWMDIGYVELYCERRRERKKGKKAATDLGGPADPRCSYLS
jgi:hypothetical protein